MKKTHLVFQLGNLQLEMKIGPTYCNGLPEDHHTVYSNNLELRILSFLLSHDKGKSQVREKAVLSITSLDLLVH